MQSRNKFAVDDLSLNILSICLLVDFLQICCDDFMRLFLDVLEC